MFRLILTFIIAIQSCALLFIPVNQANAGSSEPSIILKSEEPLTSGAILKKYVWTTERNKQQVQVNANVVQVDLQNPYVRLDVMTGTQNLFTKKQSVRGMATETNAVAGTNGDFYNTQAEGVPMGPEIANGKLMATPPILPGFYSFAITKDNKPVVDLFTFKGSIKAKDGAVYTLGGINKTYYWYEPNGEHSMIDGLFMYTDAWGQENRSNDGVTDPTEVLVQNGIVTQIARNDILHMVAPKDSYILRAAGAAAKFVVDHMKVGDPIVADYTILPQDPLKSYDTKQFKMMIGGHTIMVDGGKPAEFSREVASIAGYRSRTGVGYSQDERYVYLITADNSGDSKGLSMTEFQQLMLKIGVWKGLNLDGGGSTQMVARPLGENYLQLVNQTENGNERKIVNGLGVYSTAPKGEAKGLKIQGEKIIFLNEKASYALKGYDEFYNPIQSGQVMAQWTSSKAIGTFDGNNTFIPNQKGATTLTAVSGKATQSIDIKVVGRDDIQSMKIQASNSVITDNSDVKVSVWVKTKTGDERILPAELFQWEIKGMKAEWVGDHLHVTSLNGSKMGQLIARYDGFSSIVSLPNGEKKVWANFDQLNYSVTANVYPTEVKGDVNRVISPTAVGSNNYAVQIKYDMTKGTGTKAAYASFDDTGTGISIEGQPQSMGLNVFGDNSLNWLRAEIYDAKGSKVIVDLEKSINWTGWKTVSADLSSYKLTYPIKLKRIYVVDIEQGHDERSPTGMILFDDITFQYKGELPAADKNQVKLTIDKKTITVNGKSMDVDQAPIIISGNTMVPVRFVTDAMGGEIKWEDTERKVTVLRGTQLMDMWVDNANLIANGDVVTAEVPPQIVNDRTLVPLRILSEKMGWKVTWDEKTRTVTLE